MGGMVNAYRILIGKLGGIPLCRPLCRQEDNTETHLRRQIMSMWYGFIWLRIGELRWMAVVNLLGCINDLS
jgi:hypothetical protein